MLLQRLRGYNERGVKAFFTRDCYHFELSNWHFDSEVTRCLRSWYLRGMVAIASVLHPLVKAYGAKFMASVIEDLDVSKIDIKDNLLRDLSALVYDAVINYMNEKKGLITSGVDLLLSRVINQGIGDLMAQIQRVETMMKNCKGGVVNFEGEELDCQDLWLYDAYLHQTLKSLEDLARKYNVVVEPDRKPWWLWA